MDRILVCTDGSHYGQVACRYAASLAKKNKLELTALYVTDLRLFEIPAVADLSGSLGIQPFEGMIQQLQEVEIVKAKFVEEQAMSVFSEEGVQERVKFVHETGLLVDVVRELTKTHSFTILGKRGENVDYDKEHLGSMLERIVRSSKVPCFVTNRAYAEINEIAIAYDGSPSCLKAVDFFCAQPGFHSMRFHVLCCVEGHDEETASQRLSDVEARFDSVGIKATYQMLSGVVESAIADYVETSDIQLLALGAYGHSRIRELLIGSTTTELIRRCHVPVFCFR